MTNFVALAKEIEERDFRLTCTSAGVEQIHQTERNALKTELLDALCEDFAETFEVVGRTSEGILIEVPCASLADKLSPDSCGSGAITLAIDIKIKSLDTDIQAELDAYAVEVEEKLAKEKAKAEKKARKIAKDSQARAKKGE